MADTGWVRPTSIPTYPGSNLTNPTNLISPNSGESVYDGDGQVARILLSDFNFSIPEGSLITGISYRIKAKYTGAGTVPSLSTRLINGNIPSVDSSTQTDTLSLSSTEYVHGGDGDYLALSIPLVSFSDVSLDFNLEITATNPSGLDITLTGDNSDPTPAIKIFYDPPPDGTQSTSWTRFGNVASNSNNWFINTDPTVLESGNEGSLGIYPASLPGPWWFILDTPDSFGIPADATITGIMCTFLSELSGNSTTPFQSQAKISLSSFTNSDITEDWFGDIESPSATQFPLMTGSYGNLFGLSITTPDDLSNLRLGFQVSQLIAALSTALFTGEEGNGSFPQNYPAPAVKIFYTTPPAPPATGENSLSLTSGQLSIRSGQIYIR